MYILTRAEEKTAALLALAAQDEFFAPLIKDLQNFGFEIRYPIFSNSGEYQPYAVETTAGDFMEIFKTAVARGEFKAQFRLSPRFGRGAVHHYFLHELTHFWQDMHGLFLTPLQDGKIIQPDLRSHIEITLLCEAIAATEAIRASLRLREKGNSSAWNGAFWSVDWHELTKEYTKNVMTGMKESEAATRCFESWYSTPARRYYETRAFRTYKNHGQDYRSVNVADLVSLIPENERPPYFSRIKNRLETEYKSCGNPNWRDIKIGAPPYLWKRMAG